MESPAGSVKRHSRNVSYARPRKSTRGPLDEADEYDTRGTPLIMC